MTLLLAVLLPLSLRWLARHWHAGIHLHGFVFLIYFVEVVRRHSHPHAWVFNLPVGVFLVADRVAGVFWRRFSADYTRVTLSPDYLLLLWRHPRAVDAVGAQVYARLQASSAAERRHPLIAFENRVGLSSVAGRRGGWTHGAVVRVYRRRRRPALGARDRISHTARLADGDDRAPPPLTLWGPFQGSMSELALRRMARPGDVALVGGGSAVSFLIDALQFSTLPGCECTLSVLFSTRDAALLQWAVAVFAEIQGRRGGKRRRSAPQRTKALVVAALTSTGPMGLHECPALLPSAERPGVMAQAGRIRLKLALPDAGTVFVQGGAAIREAVDLACIVRGCTLHTNARFD